MKSAPRRKNAPRIIKSGKSLSNRGSIARPLRSLATKKPRACCARNRRRRRPRAIRAWLALRAKVIVEDDDLTFDRSLVFDVTKDKLVLYTALACGDVLLTLDCRDFQTLLVQNIYGLRINASGEFFRAACEAGRNNSRL